MIQNKIKITCVDHRKHLLLLNAKLKDSPYRYVNKYQKMDVDFQKQFYLFTKNFKARIESNDTAHVPTQKFP